MQQPSFRCYIQHPKLQTRHPLIPNPCATNPGAPRDLDLKSTVPNSKPQTPQRPGPHVILCLPWRQELFHWPLEPPEEKPGVGSGSNTSRALVGTVTLLTRSDHSQDRHSMTRASVIARMAILTALRGRSGCMGAALTQDPLAILSLSI